MTIDSSIGNTGFQNANTWIIDSGATRHMTGVWGSFLSITEKGPRYYVESKIDGPWGIKGVGTVQFRLKFGETLEVDGVLFVPRL